MSTAIKKGMLVATRDVDITGIWRGKTGRVGRIVGPNIWLWFRGESQLAGPFTADQLGPSPQLNLLVEGEDLEQKLNEYWLAGLKSYVESLVYIAREERPELTHPPTGAKIYFDSPQARLGLIEQSATQIISEIEKYLTELESAETEIKIHDRREESS